MEKIKQYAQRDPMALDEAGGYYFRHASAMTGEGLHAKSDIAAELGFRDMRIDALESENAALKALLAGKAIDGGSDAKQA
jgi:hypothetical protein